MQRANSVPKGILQKIKDRLRAHPAAPVDSAILSANLERVQIVRVDTTRVRMGAKIVRTASRGRQPIPRASLVA